MPKERQQDWDPRAPEVLDDQRHAYDNLRERCPVAYSDAMHWSLFRHEDVVSVLDDPETFINSSHHMAIPNAMNGEQHEVHRKALDRHFSPEQMAGVEPRCCQIATATLGALDLPGTVDAVADIAEPIAFQTMCAFLGWPTETWQRVRDWIHGNRDATFRHDRVAAHRLADEYAAMVTDAIDDHRKRGIIDDVTGQLMNTETDGRRWTDEDIIATLRNWIAGHGTVASTIGVVIAHLASDLALQRRLRDDPSLIPAAIEEIPRMDGPLIANNRTTTRDVVIGVRSIPAGDRLALMWIAADRDPDAFDAPDEVHLDRDQGNNLLYGHGIHYCLGAPLARLELRVAMETLLAGTTAFSLGSPGRMERESYPGNGFLRVPLDIS